MSYIDDFSGGLPPLRDKTIRWGDNISHVFDVPRAGPATLNFSSQLIVDVREDEPTTWTTLVQIQPFQVDGSVVNTLPVGDTMDFSFAFILGVGSAQIVWLQLSPGTTTAPQGWLIQQVPAQSISATWNVQYNRGGGIGVGTFPVAFGGAVFVAPVYRVPPRERNLHR